MPSPAPRAGRGKQREEAEGPDRGSLGWVEASLDESVGGRDPASLPSLALAHWDTLGDRSHYVNDTATVTVSQTVVTSREIQGAQLCSGPQFWCWDKNLSFRF